ncbi:MAG: DNA polymerase I [Treponema sp.]|nr:MAG: DNA polymerase I [Treponema sp.]
MKDSVFILDSYGLIYRSYFAFVSRPLTNSHGENVSAIYGFFNSLHSLLKKYEPKILVAAMDSMTPTFRHEMYPEYKATRDKTPEDLHSQIPIIEEILEALRIPILRYNGFEADDIIATLAKRAKNENRECFIISSDKDLVQLVDEHTFVLKPGKTSIWECAGIKETKESWGVPPEKILDMLSLMGDSADNIPGVAGVGIKTAQKLLNEYNSLDGIFENTDNIKGALQKKLIAGKDNAYFSKKLITLNYNVPITETPEQFKIKSFNFNDAAKKFSLYELPNLSNLYGDKKSEPANFKSGNSIIENTTKNKKNNNKKVNTENNANKIKNFETPLQETAKLRTTELQKSKGKYVCIDEAEKLFEIVDVALKKEIVAFDTETTGTNSLETSLVGFSISFEVDLSFYFPVLAPAPELGEEIHKTISTEDAKKGIEKLFNSKNILVIMHNGKFDLKVIESCLGIKNSKAKIFDTMIATWLLDPGRNSYSMDSLAANLLGLDTIKYKDIVPKGKTFKDVAITDATNYAAEDANITLKLYFTVEPVLKKHNLYKLFEEIEMPVLILLSEMEKTGIYVDKKELTNFSNELGKKIKTCEQELFDIVGHEFNIASPKQLQTVLFQERKLTPGKKTKTGYSTDTSVLESLSSEDIVPAKILEFRAMSKLKSTYADALPLLADDNGRIHTSFIQTGTVTGRLSSRDPNLQNIPIKDEAGRKIRKAFYASEGMQLVSADYSQIELVILAHLSQDTNLISAFNEGVDVHSKTASLIFDVDIKSVQPDMRRIAKTINFGVMYGMSAFRLANELHIPRKKAAAFIDSYFKTYSGISKFMETVIQFAQTNGYVETILGRKRYIPNINSKNKMEKSGAERIAINTPIQGSAADIVKMAMIKVSDKIKKTNIKAKPLLQVHDELIFECKTKDVDELKTILKTEMEKVIKLSVPLRVSIESGKSWGEFH